MPILNYTTTIRAGRTVAEIQQILVKAGANRIAIDYDRDGRPVALAFQLRMPSSGRNGEGTTMHYRLPCRHMGVLQRLQADHASPRYRTEAHALNVSWRILKDWLEAQLALSDAGLADMTEIMLPYALVADGGTVYERWQAQYMLEDKSHG